jgi:molybdate transport system substrate-binding protein
MAAARVIAMTLLAFVGATLLCEAAEIHVYSTGAPAEAAKAVAAVFAQDTGHHLTFTVGQPATIESDLAAGDKADVVILPAPVVGMMNSSGAWRAGSTVDLARVGIGIVMRDGARPPDISTVAAIRRLLLEARSVVYPDPTSGGGSTGRAIARLIENMGIADAVGPKLTRTSAIGGGVALVASGGAEVGLFNISEILPVQGVRLIGPLPAELQNYIVFAAAIPASNAAPEPATAFVRALAAPAARPAWQRAGLEPLGRRQ